MRRDHESLQNAIQVRNAVDHKRMPSRSLKCCQILLNAIKVLRSRFFKRLSQDLELECVCRQGLPKALQGLEIIAKASCTPTS